MFVLLPFQVHAAKFVDEATGLCNVLLTELEAVGDLNISEAQSTSIVNALKDVHALLLDMQKGLDHEIVTAKVLSVRLDSAALSLEGSRHQTNLTRILSPSPYMALVSQYKIQSSPVGRELVLTYFVHTDSALNPTIEQVGQATVPISVEEGVSGLIVNLDKIFNDATILKVTKIKPTDRGTFLLQYSRIVLDESSYTGKGLRDKASHSL